MRKGLKLQCIPMAVRGTSEIVFGTPQGTFWDHSGGFLGEGGGGGCTWGPAGSFTIACARVSETAVVIMQLLQSTQKVVCLYR